MSSRALHVVQLTPTTIVPANSSRFFDDPAAARAQPEGAVRLVWDERDPYVANELFDPSLIAHDDSYCTTQVDLDEVQQLPTARYYGSHVAPHLDVDARVIDIGCGRGEFVEHLLSTGVHALGYDPVLPRSTAHLRNRYWSPGEEAADLFVMRCVLPHIPEPWRFIHDMGEACPGALLLVEFQRREWIVASSIWYQLSHDHVNVFSVDDFSARFDVVDDGTFSNGEWAWVLLRADSGRTPPVVPCPVTDDFADLALERERALSSAAALERPLVIWGAAGKGIVLAHALLRRGVSVVAAVDADPMRQRKFLEVSGLEVLAPATARGALPADALVVVCNPNHLEDIRSRGLIAQELVLCSDLGERSIELPGTQVDLRPPRSGAARKV